MILSSSNKVDDFESEDASDENSNSQMREIEEEAELGRSMFWEPEKRFKLSLLPCSENRFKSFRRS